MARKLAPCRAFLPVLLTLACTSNSTPERTDSAVKDALSPADSLTPADKVPSPADVGDTALPPADVGDVASTPDTSDSKRSTIEDGLPPATDTSPDAADATPVEDVAPSVDDAGPFSGDGGPSIGIDAATSQLPRIIDPQVPQADVDTLAADNAAFAFAAYQKLVASDSNLVFSPASISIALAMTYAGAAGTTAAEMAQALHFSLPPARLHPAFNSLDQILASRGDGRPGADGGPMRLRIVNALWAEQTYVFRKDFLDLEATNYGAGVNLLDFVNAPEASRVTINDWVAEMTEDKILDLIPPGIIDAYTRLVLTNAVYFNAQWKTVLDPARDGTFTRLDNTQVPAKLMSADSISVPALQTATYKAVSLPYADDRLSLLVIVPEVDQFSQVEAGLDATALSNIVADLTTKRVGLTLPRFKIETAAKLKELFKALGMTSAFVAGAADFSGMDGTRNLYIAEVVHKCFINVAEKGTEAAAATAVIMKDASVPIVDLNVTATRPFLYYLRDAPTGAILFMGRVMDPSGN